MLAGSVVTVASGVDVAASKVSVGATVAVADGVNVTTLGSVGVIVGVGVDVTSEVIVAEGVRPDVGDGVGEAVGDGVPVGDGDEVGEGVSDGVLVAVDVSVGGMGVGVKNWPGVDGKVAVGPLGVIVGRGVSTAGGGFVLVGKGRVSVGVLEGVTVMIGGGSVGGASGSGAMRYKTIPAQ